MASKKLIHVTMENAEQLREYLEENVMEFTAAQVHANLPLEYDAHSHTLLLNVYELTADGKKRVRPDGSVVITRRTVKPLNPLPKEFYRGL